MPASLDIILCELTSTPSSKLASPASHSLQFNQRNGGAHVSSNCWTRFDRRSRNVSSRSEGAGTHGKCFFRRVTKALVSRPVNSRTPSFRCPRPTSRAACTSARVFSTLLFGRATAPPLSKAAAIGARSASTMAPELLQLPVQLSSR